MKYNTIAFLSCVLMGEVLAAEEAPLWKEMPGAVETYVAYLDYADPEVKQQLSYNLNMLSALSNFYGQSSPVNPEKESTINPDVVVAHAGKFYPLNAYLNGDGYCSKITFRNINSSVIHFTFSKDAYYGTVRPRLDGDYNIVNRLQLATRNIVPSHFRSAASLAGPMGFHEWLIDGDLYKENLTGPFTSLEFKINPETPMLIEFKNCSGLWTSKNWSGQPIKTTFKWDPEQKYFRFES